MIKIKGARKRRLSKYGAFAVMQVIRHNPKLTKRASRHPGRWKCGSLFGAEVRRQFQEEKAARTVETDANRMPGDPVPATQESPATQSEDCPIWPAPDDAAARDRERAKGLGKSRKGRKPK